jgi:hypothetical protein
MLPSCFMWHTFNILCKQLYASLSLQHKKLQFCLQVPVSAQQSCLVCVLDSIQLGKYILSESTFLFKVVHFAVTNLCRLDIQQDMKCILYGVQWHFKHVLQTHNVGHCCTNMFKVPYVILALMKFEVLFSFKANLALTWPKGILGPLVIIALMWSEVTVAHKCVPRVKFYPSVAQQCILKKETNGLHCWATISPGNADCLTHGKNITDNRQTDMDWPIRCSLLML